jgi:diguanylate cyclase (GGDEF)-like protein
LLPPLEASSNALRNRPGKLGIPHDLNSFGMVTISCGIAVLDRKGAQSVRDVLRDADQALYRAKQAGRNCVEMIRSLAAPTAIAS